MKIRWKHRKTKGLYEIVCHAVREADLVPVVVYRLLDGDAAELSTWVRPSAEFFDGRFIQQDDFGDEEDERLRPPAPTR